MLSEEQPVSWRFWGAFLPTVEIVLGIQLVVVFSRTRLTLIPFLCLQFHIYAIGTEECLNSIAKSVIVHSKKEWESCLKETLGDSYEMLCAHGLQVNAEQHRTVC